MSYRKNARVGCTGCRGAITAGDAELTKAGELVCRMCGNIQRIADADAAIARGSGDRLVMPAALVCVGCMCMPAVMACAGFVLLYLFGSLTAG